MITDGRRQDVTSQRESSGDDEAQKKQVCGRMVHDGKGCMAPITTEITTGARAERPQG